MSKTYESFEEYIVENYKDSIRDALLACFKKNAIYADADSYADPEKYGLKIRLIWQLVQIKHFKAPDYMLDFDMQIQALVEVDELVGGELQTNTFEDRYTLTMSAELQKGLHNLKIEKIQSGIHMREFDHDNSLTEFLTPYMNKDDYKKYAEEFLRLYYPEALEKPCYVKPPVVFDRMGLSVCFAELEKTVNGQILFADQVIERYNFTSHQYEKVLAPAGTIMLDIGLLAKEKFGMLNNAALHECVHWWLHRKYFELQMLLNPNDPSSAVFVDEMKVPNEKKFRNKYFMELQARSISPMIMMPEDNTRAIYESILTKLESRKSYHSKKKTYFYAMYKCANFFGASASCARIRLENLGYTEFEFVKKLESSAKLKPFKTSAHLEHGQSYLVDFDEAVKAFNKNPIYAEAMAHGRYVYVDGLFVLNCDKYIKRFKNGRIVLTNEAYEDVSKCCLLFDTEAESVTVEFDPAKFNMVTFCSGGATNSYKRSVSIKEEANEKVAKLKRFGVIQKQELEEVSDFIEKMNAYNSFHEKLDCLLGDDCLGCRSDRGIASKCGTTGKTITSFRNGKSKPSEKQLLAICSGLKLHPQLSRYLFTAARYNIYDTNEEPYPYYVVLLHTCYTYGLETWNMMIKEAYPEKATEYAI